MTLVQSWIDSLQLLKPKNLQLFALVTLKSIVEAYKLLFKYFWWLFVLLVGCYAVFLWPSTVEQQFYVGNYILLASRWLYQLLFFATCLVTRPSIAKKDCAYFRSHMFVFLYIAIYLAIIPMHLWPTAFSVWDIFLILFFLDSEHGPKNFFLSMWYALKMIIFNYPLLAILGIGFYLFGSLPLYLMKQGIVFFVSEESMQAQALVMMRLIYNILAALLLPIGICTYANLYIKKLHDQFDLYFTQPQ